MASPSVTYTFSNSTTADATQVNTNFTDLINGLSDGTKDLSVNAITAAGTATLNGNVNIGNASGDDLAITASLASSIPIKTTATYNIGSATLGLLSIYIGGTSSFTTRILSAATATWTLTLPATAGSSKDILVNSGSGTLAWANRTARDVLAKTANYTVLSTDELLTGDATSAAFTFTLPAAASNTGKVLTFKRIDQTLANAITIDGNASETIDGFLTVTMNTKNESWCIQSDGTNWIVLSHNIGSDITSYTPTLTGFGTATGVSFYWYRRGPKMVCDIKFTSGTSTVTEGRISLPVTSANTSASPTGTSIIPSIMVCGSMATAVVSARAYNPLIEPNVAYITMGFSSASTGSITKANGNDIAASGNAVSISCEIPVAGWFA